MRRQIRSGLSGPGVKGKVNADRYPSTVRTSEALADLVGDIYGCVTAPDRWPQVTRRISDALCSIGGVIYAGSRTDLTKSYFAVVDNFAPEHVEGYLSHYLELDPRAHFVLEGNVRTAVDDMINTETERRRHEFYDWHRSFGCWYFIGGCIALDEDAYCNIGFQRTKRQGHVGNDEIARYERLVHHVGRVVELGRRLGLVDLRLSAAEQALDRLRFGVVLIDAGGRVIFANRAAERIFSEHDGLTVRHGRLFASRHPDGSRLDRLIGESLAFPHGHLAEPGGAAAIARSSELRPYRVYVSPIGRRGIDGTFTRKAPAAVALISDPERREKHRLTSLAALYGLTPAEARMAASLSDGDDVRNFAEQAGVSLNTARWRLKQIFAKTGCRSQSELIRLILRGAVTSSGK